MNCTYNWNCPPGSFPYTVRQGDSLYTIAKKFETSVSRLSELNSVEDINSINAGDTLCIPQPLQYFPACRSTNYYVVNEQDTIDSIADYFGVSSAQILYSNIGIDEENLYTGMILCIPLAPPKLCINISENNLTLSYNDGKQVSFTCTNTLSPLSTAVVQKQIDTSFGGRKRLNLLIPGIAVSSFSAKLSDNDIILSDSDMDTVFNLVPVGTEVNIL